MLWVQEEQASIIPSDCLTWAPQSPPNCFFCLVFNQAHPGGLGVVGKSLPGHGVPAFPGQIWAQTLQARNRRDFSHFTERKAEAGGIQGWEGLEQEK